MSDNPIVAPEDMPVVQGSNEIFTSRIRGTSESDALAREDAEYLKQLGEPVQGGDEKVSRQTGLHPITAIGGVIQADQPATSGTPLVMADRPAPAAVPPPVVDVAQSDQPGEFGGDPRHKGGGPASFTPEQLHAAQQARPRLPTAPESQPLPRAAKRGRKAAKG